MSYIFSTRWKNICFGICAGLVALNACFGFATWIVMIVERGSLHDPLDAGSVIFGKERIIIVGFACWGLVLLTQVRSHTMKLTTDCIHYNSRHTYFSSKIRPINTSTLVSVIITGPKSLQLCNSNEASNNPSSSFNFLPRTIATFPSTNTIMDIPPNITNIPTINNANRQSLHTLLKTTISTPKFPYSTKYYSNTFNRPNFGPSNTSSNPSIPHRSAHFIPLSKLNNRVISIPLCFPRQNKKTYTKQRNFKIINTLSRIPSSSEENFTIFASYTIIPVIITS